MRVAVFDLETYSLNADTAILLCAVIKECGKAHEPIVVRADRFWTWDKHRSNPEPVVRKVIQTLLDEPGEGDQKGFDILVAHNGQKFDKALLNTWALKYRLRMDIRFARFIDPVMLLRRHCRLHRNSLAAAIDFFDIPHKKTPIDWNHWRKAAFDGNRESMSTIVEHCRADVASLEALYNIAKRLVKGIDEKGSAY